MRELLRKLRRELNRRRNSEFTSSPEFWEERYRLGGNSGKGSYGESARYKADFINRFIESRAVRTVVDFGCGDGNNIALLECPRYLGFDVSPTAIELCRKRFAGRAGWQFMHLDPQRCEPVSATLHRAGAAEFAEADLVLSLDVVFHLVEDPVFDAYMQDLCGCARRFAIMYATDHDDPEPRSAHVRHRRYTPVLAALAPELELLERVPNPLYREQPHRPYFCVFERRGRERRFEPDRA